MNRVLVRKSFRDARSVAIGGGLAILVNVLLHAMLYPSYGTSASMEYPDAIKGLFGEAGSSTSPAGYAGSYLVNSVTLLAVLATIAGTFATAGEEGAGTLDLLLAQPVRRWRLLLSKAAGPAAGLALAGFCSIPAFLIASTAGDQHLSIWRLAQAVLSFTPFVCLFLALGMWLGAWLPSRAVAGTASTAVLVVSYFLNAIGTAADFLTIPRRFSVFYWIDPSHVLLHGIDWPRSLAMAGGAALLFALAVVAFERREIATGPAASEVGLGWRHRPRRLGTSLAPRLGGRLSGRLGLVVKAARDARGQAIGAGAAALSFVLLDVLLYPSFSEAIKSFEYPSAIQGMLGEAGSIASPAGFMTAQFFNVTPLIFVTVAILAGTGATAGEEAAGTIDLLLSQPLTRRRFFLSKWAGISVALFLATAVAIPGFVFARWVVDMDLSNARFIAAEANVMLLESVFLALALLAGVLCPTRSSAVVVTVTVMVACYLLLTLGALSDFFDVAQRISPFYWASAPHVLLGGFDWLRATALAATSLALIALGLWRFERRDLAAGRGDWHLAGLLPRNSRD